MIVRRILNFLLQPAVIAALGVLVIALLSMSWCSGRNDRVANQNTQIATGKALDRVAEQTPVIRQDQEEKHREVDEIPGADQRLPDGFGRDLERVRRGDRDPR